MLNLQKLEKYKSLIETEQVLPIGRGKDRKAPCNKRWQLNPNLSLEDIYEFKDAIALGVTTPNLWVLDIDGESAVRWASGKGLLGGEHTWEVHRTTSPYYFKRIFRPTLKQIEQIPENPNGLREFQFKVKTSKLNYINEAVEFFMAHNRQIIFYGRHFKSGGDYISYPNRDFKDVRPPTDKEWKVCLEEIYKHQEKLPRTISRSHGRDWFTLDICPICGRDQHNICQMHRDGETIRCFEGVTYRPPQNLKPGEVIHDDWAYVRTQYVGWGDFSIFVKHKPTPTQLSFRRWRSV